MSKYKVERLGDKLFRLEATDSQDFISREVIGRTEAEQLIRQLIMAVYGDPYHSGYQYTAVVLNGIFRPIDSLGEPELTEKRAQEAAETKFFLTYGDGKAGS